jgi:hypothetical protein
LLLFQNASNYVQEKGFKQTKFIDSAVLLDFEKPLCCSVLRFFSITEYIKPQQGQSLTDAQTTSNANRERIRRHYWEGIKHHVRKVLNSCRSNRCAEMGKCFTRTYDSLLSFFFT